MKREFHYLDVVKHRQSKNMGEIIEVLPGIRIKAKTLRTLREHTLNNHSVLLPKVRQQTTVIIGEGPTEFYYLNSLKDEFRQLQNIKPGTPGLFIKKQ